MSSETSVSHAGRTPHIAPRYETSGGHGRLHEYWFYRELFLFFCWRDIKVRYKQTVLGVFWAVLQPLVTTAVFVVIFQMKAKLPTGGLPGPIFYYSGLLGWLYFANAFAGCSNSLLTNAALVTKVYFPRELIPLATVLTFLFDFSLSSLVLVGLLVFYGVSFNAQMLFWPILILPLVIVAYGGGLLMSSLNVRFRDIKHVVPFVVQLGMFVTVILPNSDWGGRWKWLVDLNPAVGVVEGYRSMIDPDKSIDFRLWGMSLLISTVVLVIGFIYFRRTERTFADII